MKTRRSHEEVALDLEAAQQIVTALTKELEELELQSKKNSGCTSGEALRKGLRIQITIADKYYKRLGTLEEKTRGGDFWWIILDQKREEKGKLRIRKKASSFRVFPDQEFRPHL